MMLLIDEVKCTGCGRCVYICPKQVLYLDKKKAKVKENNDCMLCSHCYDVCEYYAIGFSHELESIKFKTFKYSEKILGSKDISPGMFVNALRSRRSIRKYKSEEIDVDILKDLVEFAVTAPSGSNCQDWKFTVINGREKVLRLANSIKDFFIRINRLSGSRLIRYLSLPFMGKTMINYYRDHYQTVELAIKESKTGADLLFHGAPCVIIVHGSMDGSTPVEDAAFASYNICMMAHYMDLGTCMIGFAVEALNRSRSIKTELDIHKKNRIHSVIAIGYPDVKFNRQSLRKKYSVEFI